MIHTHNKRFDCFELSWIWCIYLFISLSAIIWAPTLTANRCYYFLIQRPSLQLKSVTISSCFYPHVTIRVQTRLLRQVLRSRSSSPNLNLGTWVWTQLRVRECVYRWESAHLFCLFPVSVLHCAVLRSEVLFIPITLGKTPSTQPQLRPACCSWLLSVASRPSRW